MNKMTKKVLGAFTAILVVAAIILAGYFMLNKRAMEQAEGSNLPTTEVGKLLAKDLETKYPETPTEVVKLYWRINRCLYNGVSDKDMEKVLKQLRLLYDEEFLADSNNSFENMLKNLKKDVEKHQDGKETFSSTIVQKNDTLKVNQLDGKDCTTVMTATLIKAKGKSAKLYEEFMCRKDNDGKWKILGWKQVSAEEAGKVDIE